MESEKALPPLALNSKSDPRTAVGIECLFALAIVLLGAVAVWRLAVDGYLPAPFYFRVDETLMDLYSTAFWANNGGAYLTWHSLYPPLSFVFLRLFSIHSCYVHGPVLARMCDWRAATTLMLVFVSNIWLVLRSYQWMRIHAAIPRTIAVCLGLPMLYSLERGNLLIPCFTCFVLAFSDLLRWSTARWLVMALAINFKPYLVFSLLPFVGRRAWNALFICGLLFVAIYGLTYFVEGSGAPLDVIGNESRYAAVKSARYFSDIYFDTSYWPLIRLLRAAPAGLVLVPPGVANAASLFLEIAIRLAQAGFAVCSILAIVRPYHIDVRRFGALVASTSLVAFTTGSAGYVQIFLFFLTFYEAFRGPVRIIILTACYLLCLPVDYLVAPVIHDPAISFLSGRHVVANFGLSVGQLVRPGILLTIQFGLIAINLSDLLTRSVGIPTWAFGSGWFSSTRSPNGGVAVATPSR